MADNTKTTRPADAEIAQAMGWRREPAYGGAALAWKNADGIVKNLPYFHADHNAKHALLVWLAADEARWTAFDAELNCLLRREFDGRMPREWWHRRAFMLASPAQVAEAALEVIRQEEDSKQCN